MQLLPSEAWRRSSSAFGLSISQGDGLRHGGNAVPNIFDQQNALGNRQLEHKEQEFNLPLLRRMTSLPHNPVEK